MPSKNEVKEYIADSYYHLYNRGVEKRRIFESDQDYHVFISYLKTYLLPKDEAGLRTQLADPKLTWNVKDILLKELRLKNYNGEIKLVAFCLMPNHFHLLVYQKGENAIDAFMNSLVTRYSMYFNRKYKRVGPLFQGVYKAVRVETDEQLLHLSRYIHLQAILNPQGLPLQKVQPSSYKNYLGDLTQEWVDPSSVLANFSTNQSRTKKDNLSYKSFVESNIETPKVIYKLMIDD